MVSRDRSPARRMPLVRQPKERSALPTVAIRLLLVLAVLAISVSPQAAAAAPMDLTGALPAGWDVWGYSVTNDGSYVVYCVDPTANSVWDSWELYSVPTTGGTPVRLNGDLAVAGWPTWAISPDGTRVVYTAMQTGDAGTQLYSVPIGGPAGAAVRIDRELTTTGGVSEFYITPNSATVVYVSDQETRQQNELYSVAITGGISTKLNGAIVEGGRLWSSTVVISPDGSRAIYRASQDTKGVSELYCVPVGGGTPVKLNGELVEGGDVQSGAIFSPDGRWVIYRADQDTDEAVDLYRAPVGGGAPVRISAAMPGGRGVYVYDISPDGSRVAYVADQDTDDLYEIYSVPLLGGSVVKLNGPIVAGGSVWLSVDISSDSSHLVYQATQDDANVAELFSVPLSGGTAQRLNAPLVAGGGVSHHAISPDGSTVVYAAEQDTDGVTELYSVPIGGGTAEKLNGALVGGGDVATYFWHISPDSTRVVYVADQEVDEKWELYSVPIGGGVPFKLSGVMPASGDVRSCITHPDSTRTLYVAHAAGAVRVYLADDGRTSASFANPSATIGEGDGSLELIVNLSAPADQPMAVDYTAVGGTATGGGVDYALAAGTLAFAVGESSKTLAATIVEDGLPETNETVVVSLGRPINAAIGAISRCTVTIVDNERAFYLPQSVARLAPQ